MALIQMNYFSFALKMNTSLNIIIPTPTSDECINKKHAGGNSGGGLYQVLYLLHGTYGDHTEWCRYTSIEKYAQKYNLAVVMPSCENSYYYNMYSGSQYFTFITEELPSMLSGIFPLSTKREDTFIAGLSMGGYGAWNIAISNPEQYAAAANLSGDLDLSNNMRIEQQKSGPWPFQAIFHNFDPVAFENSEDNLIVKLQKKLNQNSRLPRLYHSVGTEDFIFPRVQQARAKLKDPKECILFESNPGIHDWKYWDISIQRVLEWFGLKSKNSTEQAFI